jgi:hypothetical protein
MAHKMGLNHTDISARSLHAGGTMVLMYDQIYQIYHNTIHMLGRWHIDAMLRYLHLQAKPLMQQFTVIMFNYGTYSFLPTNTVPCGDY